MRRNFLPALLALALFPACGDSQQELIQRVARSVAAIPSVVRVVGVTDPQTLRVVDASALAFQTFAADPTNTNWRTALNVWNGQAKDTLLGLNNERLTAIVAVVDILLTQVVMPEIAPAARGVRIAPVPVETKFKERDVKRLEELVK